MIPKIFHLTAKSLELPTPFQDNLARIKTYYPEHEIRLYDDNDIRDFAKTHFEEYYERVFKNMPAVIMQVDTIRYMWMYINGGIYCDFDIRFLKHYSFEEGVCLFKREWTFPEDPSIRASVHNCCFASEPGHPLWLEILEGIATNLKRAQHKSIKDVAKRFFRKQKKTVLTEAVFNITGPNAISKVITQKNLLDKYRDIHLLPGSAIYQAGRSIGSPTDAYVIHETAASWK